tara:strand:- start:842 stop:1426 length:585 start_codon:yes stop_codon:yes gene_type:complete
MSEYFSNFPKILYDIDGTSGRDPNYSTAVNMLIRQKFRDAIKDDITIYYPYVIPEEVKRPDILSYQIYGDVKFTWTIFLANQIFDPYWQWPMDTRTFENYLIGKYGSVEESKLKVEYYEKIWQERVEATGTSDPIPEQTVRIDYTTYLETNTDLRRIKYAYEYEQDKNESLRSIQLIQPVFISSVLDEARGFFR